MCVIPHPSWPAECLSTASSAKHGVVPIPASFDASHQYLHHCDTCCWSIWSYLRVTHTSSCSTRFHILHTGEQWWWWGLFSTIMPLSTHATYGRFNGCWFFHSTSPHYHGQFPGCTNAEKDAMGTVDCSEGCEGDMQMDWPKYCAICYMFSFQQCLFFHVSYVSSCWSMYGPFVYITIVFPCNKYICVHYYDGFWPRLD